MDPQHKPVYARLRCAIWGVMADNVMGVPISHCQFRVSHAAGRHVAIDLAAESDEDDAVSGRVSFVPFDLVVRDDNLFAELPVWTAERTIRAFVSDDGDIAILGPIRVGFAAARHERC